MAGNVYEWIQDWYSADAYRMYGSQALQIDPLGPESGDEKVIRGGSWISPIKFVRCSHRRGQYPGICTNDVGFRALLAEHQL